jgi:hypothetical protein
MIDPTTGDVPHDISVTNDIPSLEIQAAAADLPVMDSEGKSIPFSQLYSGKRTMIVFIRHFLCGVSGPSESSHQSLTRSSVELPAVPREHLQVLCSLRSRNPFGAYLVCGHWVRSS